MAYPVFCLLLSLMEFQIFTFTVKDIVTWEHDPTAHNVPFIAAWTKRIPHSTPMEDFAIVCINKNKKMHIIEIRKRLEENTHVNWHRRSLGDPKCLQQSKLQKPRCRQYTHSTLYLSSISSLIQVRKQKSKLYRVTIQGTLPMFQQPWIG